MQNTTTKGVLWELLAPVVRWPLYSPTRLVLVVAGVLALVIGIGQVTGTDPDTSPAATQATDTPVTSDPAVTTDPALPSPSEGDVESSAATPHSHSHSLETPPPPRTRQRVKRLTRRFAEAYTATGKPREAWLQGLRRLVTPELATALGTVDPTNIDLGDVLRVKVAGVSEVAGAAEVETARGQLVVDLAYSGRRWQVTRVQPRAAPGS